MLTVQLQISVNRTNILISIIIHRTIILDLVPKDTALYTCTASSESGETSWSASLSVEDPKNPNIMFHKTPDPATFPQSPTKPKIVDRRSTSVTMSWRRNSNTGQSPLIG